MADEESQATAIPISNQAAGDQTARSQNEKPQNRQPRDKAVLQILTDEIDVIKEKFWPSIPKTSTRDASSYTSKAFLYMPTPMPVSNVLVHKPRYMILVRVVPRALTLLFGILILSSMLIPLVFYFFLTFYWNLEDVSEVATSAFKFQQVLWEWVWSRFLLRHDQKFLTSFWWSGYFLIASRYDFETNYIRAWAEHAADSQKRGLIFVGDEQLSIPQLEGDELDKTRLEHLLMFYRLLKIRRGLLEVILPRTLVRIDWVKVENESQLLGERLQIMDLGRRPGNLVARFQRPSLIEEGSQKLDEEERTLKQNLKDDPKNDGVSLGIEFVRQYNRGAMIRVVSIPPISSLIFAAVWMGWFLTREKDENYDVQEIVSTAFTGASYLVTAGALGIALVSFLDTKVDDDTPRVKDGAGT